MAREKDEIATALTFEQLKELLEAGKSEPISHAQIADIAAAAAVKAKMPENKQHPHISVFSHPEGDLAHPKGNLKCRMYIGEAPIERTTVTPAELESLNRMTPGHYRVEKTDGSKAVVEVRGQVNSNREIERMWIVIPKDDPGKNNYGRRLNELTDQFIDANRVQTVLA
jgi:hypothetical protein